MAIKLPAFLIHFRQIHDNKVSDRVSSGERGNSGWPGDQHLFLRQHMIDRLRTRWAELTRMPRTRAYRGTVSKESSAGAAPRTGERAHDSVEGARSQDGLRDAHPTLDARRFARGCLLDRPENRNRNARPQLDQSSRHRVAALGGLDRSYAGSG